MTARDVGHALEFFALFVAELALVQLHGPGGQLIYVNPHEVTSVRTPQVKSHFAEGTKCLLYMSNSHFISVIDTCDQVLKRLNNPSIVDK